MHADYFFFSFFAHAPTPRPGWPSKRNNHDYMYIARLSIVVHVIPFFSRSGETETKDILEIRERKIRIFLSYKIHFSDPLGTLERVGFRTNSLRGEGDLGLFETRMPPYTFVFACRKRWKFYEEEAIKQGGRR